MHTKWAAFAGIVFTVTFIAGMVIITNSPDITDSDQSIIDWYADSGHQNAQLAGAYLLTISGIAAAVFVVTGLGPRLAAAARDETSRALAAMVGPAGILMAGSIMAGAFAIAACSASIKFDNVSVDPGVARFLPSVGYGAILVGGGLTGAFVIAVSSLVALRDNAFAAWLSWLGFVCALALLVAVMFMPMIALPIWILLVSVSFLTSSQRVVLAPAS